MTITARLFALLAALGLAACVTEDTQVTTKGRVELTASVTNFVPPEDSPIRAAEPDAR